MGSQIEKQKVAAIVCLNMDSGYSEPIWTGEPEKARWIIDKARKDRKIDSPEIWGIKYEWK